MLPQKSADPGPNANPSPKAAPINAIPPARFSGGVLSADIGLSRRQAGCSQNAGRRHGPQTAAPGWAPRRSRNRSHWSRTGSAKIKADVHSGRRPPQIVQRRTAWPKTRPSKRPRPRAVHESAGYRPAATQNHSKAEQVDNSVTKRMMRGERS